MLDPEGLADETVFVYLEAEDVFTIYRELPCCTSFHPADHLLDRDRLEAALARPQHHAEYEGADLAQQAAVLAHGIVHGHAFYDGNKRTGLESMRLFLYVNGFQISRSVTQVEREDWMIRLAEGGPWEDLAERLRVITVPMHESQQGPSRTGS